MEYISRYERRIEERAFKMGEVAVLKRQLTKRFGDLPGWAEERLEEAPAEELESWSERVLDSGRLEDVFTNEPTSRA